MPPPDRHVVFNPSAAGTLRAVLAGSGEILCPADNLAIGPIGTDDPQLRVRWMESELGTDWSDIVATPAFGDWRVPVTLWVDRRSAQSLAGFLWWLSHVGSTPVSVIACDDMALLSPEVLAGFLDRATPLAAEARASHVTHWRRLQAEDAPLRVLDGDRLVSAPIDHFDGSLLRNVTADWQKMALIVGKTLFDCIEADAPHPGDLLLAGRLARLAEAGRLDWQGDLSNMHACTLRRPDADPDAGRS